MSHILTPDIEAQTLALLTAQIMGDKYPFTAVTFEYALPTAYECLQATRRFLQKKEEEESAKAKAYWESGEGKKRRAEIKARFAEFGFKKKNR